MIRIEVLFFAQIREALGVDGDVLEMSEGAKVGEVVELLRDRPRWSEVAAIPMSFAVNEELVRRDHTLRDGDRVAILTPVSGG